MPSPCDLRRLAAAQLLLAAVGTAAMPVAALTLREAYEAAGPGSGYDKYVVLEPGTVYTGGLLIGPVLSPLTWELEGEAGVDVRIVGNGAILDLEGEQICISYCNQRLDIDDCIVLHGTIRFRGMQNTSFQVQPTGSVRHVTFYEPDGYGIRLQGTGGGVLLERNLLVDTRDTGRDCIHINGIPHEWLPTGANVCLSVQTGTYGTPTVRENWSFHGDPGANADPLRHFLLLCEYG